MDIPHLTENNKETDSDNPNTMTQIEKYLQEQFNIFVPILIIEYNQSNIISSNLTKWDIEDLKDVFSHFGKVDLIEVNGLTSIILFETFLDALTSKNFLMNSSNLKEFAKDQFIIKWYSQEHEELISEVMKQKIKRFTCGDIVENINTTMLNSIDVNTPMYYPASMKTENYSTNHVEHYNYYTKFSLCPNGRKEFNGVMLGNKRRAVVANTPINTYGMNSNANGNLNSNLPCSGSNVNEGNECEANGEKCLSNGKLTCKFWVQIENDVEFQVAKRLIGAKGCNMKRIIDFCSKGPNGNYINDAVKLRLRGKGSGYKEGPYNRESDESLHLCVSSRYMEKYRRACSSVQELLINIYEEYKRYCERNNRPPTNNLTIQKLESISTRRTKQKEDKSQDDY